LASHYSDWIYSLRTVGRMTREEIERRMDELAREYVETHDQKIIEELYKLALELGRMLKESAD
jgi:ferritin-like protein